MTTPASAPDASAPPRPTRAGWRETALPLLVLAAVMAWALPRAIQAGDAGEFSTVMLRGGIPHPSGYPWMRLLGLVSRALWAMGCPPALACALPCAVLGLIGWGFLHRVALRCAGEHPSRARTTIATLSLLVPATSASVVLHVNDAEVWGPLLAFVGAFAWLCIVRRARPEVLGLALGLGVSHHLTAVLLLPLAVAAAWPTDAPAGPGAIARAGLRGLAGSAVGLLAWFTLMLGDHGPEAAWAWGSTETVAGLLHHVSRADYGVFALSLQDQAPPGWAQIRRVLETIGGAFSAQLSPHWLLSGVLLVVPALLAARRTLLPRRLRAGLLTSVALSAVVFPLAHNLDPTSPFSAWILERFDLMPIALLVPVVALALAPLPGAVADRGRAGFGLAAGGTLLVVRQLIFTAWHGIPSDNPWIEKYARDVLATPTSRAIVVGTDDHRTFPLLYAQRVLELGPQVLYIDASLLAHPWYRARLRTQLPALPEYDKPVLLLTAMQADPAWDDTALYLTNDFSRHSVGLPRVPEGVLWRLVHPRLPPPSPEQVLERHKAALARYGALPKEAFMTAHPFAADLLASYLETTSGLAKALRAEGRADEADALLRFGADPSAAPAGPAASAAPVGH